MSEQILEDRQGFLEDNSITGQSVRCQEPMPENEEIKPANFQKDPIIEIKPEDLLEQEIIEIDEKDLIDEE